jgi:hypothetical protein
MIDRKLEGMLFFRRLFNRKETWYGSALAIKYLNENLTETIETVDKNGEIRTKTSTPRSTEESNLVTDRDLMEAQVQIYKVIGKTLK